MAFTSGPSSAAAMLLSTGKYSDLTIKCQSKTFKVHRAIVCTQSKPLAAAIDGSFKEAATGVINLEGNEADIVDCMLKFLYTSDYSDGSKDTPARPPGSRFIKSRSQFKTGDIAEGIGGSLLINTKVYIIADKYDIAGLKELATKKYEKNLLSNWNTALFTASLRLMYENTIENDRLLKDVAVEAAREHAKDLLIRDEFSTACKEVGGLAFDVLKASLGSICSGCRSSKSVCHEGGTKYHCDDCNRFFSWP